MFHSQRAAALALRIATLCAGLAFGGAATATPSSVGYTGVSCSGHATGMTALPGYVACSGAWSGNNSNQAAFVDAQVQADWGLALLAPVDVTPGAADTPDLLKFSTAENGKFVISLKAGDAFSLYEFDGSLVAGGISSIDFDTLGVGFRSGGKDGTKNTHFGQALSHADLYGVVTAVPEPGSTAMLLAGLGGLALVARRRARAG